MREKLADDFSNHFRSRRRICGICLILDESPDAAARFADRVDKAYDEIIENPHRCPIRENGLREKLVRGFPFSIFYSLDQDEIVIEAVAHQSRKPGYWRDRL